MGGGARRQGRRNTRDECDKSLSRDQAELIFLLSPGYIQNPAIPCSREYKESKYTRVLDISRYHGSPGIHEPRNTAILVTKVYPGPGFTPGLAEPDCAGKGRQNPSRPTTEESRERGRAFTLNCCLRLAIKWWRLLTVKTGKGPITLGYAIELPGRSSSIFGI